MKATTLICLVGLAVMATAEEKVTGYHSASAAVLAKSGKILISTVLTPEVQEAPVNQILPVPQPPIIEDHQNSIQPVAPVIKPLPVVSPPVSPIGILPVIQPLPVVSPPVSGGQPAPLPAEGGNLIPDIIAPEKPSFGLFPIIEEGNQNSIMPVVEVGHKLPIAIEEPQPVIQPLPVVSPPVPGGQPAPLPAEGGNLIPDIIAPEKPSFGLFPIIEEGNQNSIMPVVEVGHKLPIAIEGPKPVVSPPVSGGQPAPLPAEGGNLIPDIIAPEKPSFGLFPIIEEGNQNSILPVVEVGHKLPIAIEEPQPVIQPLPVVSPPVSGGQPAPLPAEGGNLIPDIIGKPVALPAEGGNLIPDIIGKPVALPAEGGNLIPDDIVGANQPVPSILPIQEELPVRPKPVYFPENGIIF